MLNRLLLPSFTGSLASGQKAVCDVPLGYLYDVLWLELGDSNGNTSLGNGANVPATLDNLIALIEWIIDGETVYSITASRLNGVQSLNGAAYAVKTSGTAGQAAYRMYLPIYLGEPWRKSHVEQRKLSVNLSKASKVKDAQIRITWGGAALTGTAVVEGWFEGTESDESRGIGLVKKLVSTDFSTGGSNNDVLLLRREYLQAVHFFPTSGGKYVNTVEIIGNGHTIHERLNTLRNQAVLLGRELNPDTSAAPRYPVVFDYDDPIDNALPAGAFNSLLAKLEYSAAANGENLPIVYERVGALAG